MPATSIDVAFQSLYAQLMKVNFMAASKPKFGARPTEAAVSRLVAGSESLLPAPFREHYATPLITNLASLFSRLSSGGGLDTLTLETFTGAVYEQSDRKIQQPLHRFLAVISNLYRSFLDNSKRAHLDIPLKETLPPLAVFQSDPSSGPFTITCEMVSQLIGGTVGVVSMPLTFANHPLFYGSLAHETSGHDVIHADATLMPQLRAQVYSLFTGADADWMGLLWDYWMDEVAADVYGVLNVGPSFGYNLAMLLAVFIGQFKKPAAKTPSLRTISGADESGALDVHPTDILRLSLVQGVVEALSGLSPSTRSQYITGLSRLSQTLAPGASTVELVGLARVRNGKSMNFQQAVRLDQIQEAARQVGAMIATSAFDALDGHSVQDIETWDDADENTAVTIAGRLHTNSSIVGAGDDAAIIAGLTLAAFQNPARYSAVSGLANDALDDSFASDPYWGTTPRDQMVLRPSRTLKNPEVDVDPYAAKIIDYNPLEEDAAESQRIGLDAAMVNKHAIAPIPWPAGEGPAMDPSFTFKGADAELPKADFVIFTWTSAEANSMSAVMTPGSWAMPPSKSKGPAWYEYTNQWDSKFAGRSFGQAPAATQHYIGKYMPILIAGKKVLLFKSNFHLARDDKSMPVKDMFKQVIQQTEAKLVITSGTAGAIGPKLKLGDVVIANSARFHCGRNFKSAPFNGKTYTCNYKPSQESYLKVVNSKLVGANADQLGSQRSGNPTVYTFDIANNLKEPMVIITTDEFEFDDKTDKFGLQGLGAMVEMDDAVLGLAIQEMGSSTKWLAIRNASDPQMPNPSASDSSDIYAKYGYWTSIPSALASWASVLDF